jgi:hypothetical protein
MKHLTAFVLLGAAAAVAYSADLTVILKEFPATWSQKVYTRANGFDATVREKKGLDVHLWVRSDYAPDAYMTLATTSVQTQAETPRAIAIDLGSGTKALWIRMPKNAVFFLQVGRLGAKVVVLTRSYRENGETVHNANLTEAQVNWAIARMKKIAERLRSLQ